MHRFLASLVTVGFLLGLARPARAASALAVTDVKVSYEFGQQITISARLQSTSAIQGAMLFFQAEGDPTPRSAPLALGPDGSARYDYSVQGGLIRPFARVTFWFQAALATGETVASSRYFFTYDDNRFVWQTAEAENLNLHWTYGSFTFGQAALDAARAGLRAIQTLIPVQLTEPVDIYVYASAADVQSALGLGGMSWVGGDASPDLGVVMVSVAPGDQQDVELGRQIPHELAHVLLYRMTGPAYGNLPAWLREGLASLVEGFPNADDAQVLIIASQNKALIPMTDLCGLFPQDASGASLAYAESASFTRYLHDTYGTSGLQALIRAYADGLDCDQGAARAVGMPVGQLDLRWQQAVLGRKVGGLAFESLLPYLVVLLVVLLVPAWFILQAFRRKEGYGSNQSK